MNTWWNARRERLRNQLRTDSQEFARLFAQDSHGERRFDAGETGVLATQLEAMMATAFDLEYPESMAMRLLPIDETPAPGADTIAYRQGQPHGQAAVISNYADDFPLVERTQAKFTQQVVPFGSAYQLTVQELRGAALAGIPIEVDKARDARAAIDRALDDLAWTGNTEYNLTGFANNATCVTNLVSALTGTWSGASADQIINDVGALLNAVFVNTKQLHEIDTLLVSTAQWGYLQRPRSSTSDVSIHDYIKGKFNNIRDIFAYHKLDTGDVAGTGSRLIGFKRSPDVCRVRITQTFEQRPPQERNMSYVVNCHLRSAGTLMLKPLAVAYMDGC